MISAFFTGLLVILGLVYYFRKRSKLDGMELPGPKGYPLIGNLFQLDRQQHLSFTKWAKEFGPIYKVGLATTKSVVVSDYKILKEMFAEEVFSGRMDFAIFDFVPDGNVHGLVNTEGKHWEEIRRFTIRNLRDFGFGRKTMEETTMIEVEELIGIIKESEGKPMSNVKERFLIAVVNALWFIMTGSRQNQKDESLLKMITGSNEAFDSVQESGGLLLFFPLIAKIFPEWSGYNFIRKQLEILADYYRKAIESHKKTISDDFDRDFIDTFLKQIKKTTAEDSAFRGKLGEDNLLAVISDLYFGGSDTTAATLSWMILYLSKYPEIQKKLQAEIESMTGNTRACSLADRPEMPYTEAVLEETLRFSAITPQGLSHRALHDTKFKGYSIEKGAVIIPNIYYIHNDPEIWGDPENFRPERFLSPDGKMFKKHEAMLVFSTGKRQCLGESLARDSIFLFATNVFQRFWIEFDKNGPDHGWEPNLSFVLAPKPYNVFFKDRLQ